MKEVTKYKENHIDDIEYAKVSSRWDLLKEKISNIKKYQKWSILFYTLALYFDILLALYFYSPNDRWSRGLIYDPWYIDLMQVSAITILLFVVAKLLTFIVKEETNK